MTFQDPASPTMSGIINLHHDIMFIVVLLSIFVCWLLVRTVYFFDMEQSHSIPAFRQIYNLPDKTVHGTAQELGWTIVPTLILSCHCASSDGSSLFDWWNCRTFVNCEVAWTPMILIVWVFDRSNCGWRAINWSGWNTFTFDSYMKDESDLEVGDLRLLEVDNRLVLPVQKHIRVIVTAADVLHCRSGSFVRSENGWLSRTTEPSGSVHSSTGNLLRKLFWDLW